MSDIAKERERTMPDAPKSYNATVPFHYRHRSVRALKFHFVLVSWVAIILLQLNAVVVAIDTDATTVTGPVRIDDSSATMILHGISLLGEGRTAKFQVQMEEYIKSFYDGTDNNTACNGLLAVEVNITVTNSQSGNQTGQTRSLDQTNQTTSAPSQNQSSAPGKNITTDDSTGVKVNTNTSQTTLSAPAESPTVELHTPSLNQTNQISSAPSQSQNPSSAPSKKESNSPTNINADGKKNISNNEKNHTGVKVKTNDGKKNNSTKKKDNTGLNLDKENATAVQDVTEKDPKQAPHNRQSKQNNVLITYIQIISYKIQENISCDPNTIALGPFDEPQKMKSLSEQLAKLKTFENLESITLSTTQKSSSQSNAQRIDINLHDIYGSVVKFCMGIVALLIIRFLYVWRETLRSCYRCLTCPCTMELSGSTGNRNKSTKALSHAEEKK